MFKEFEDYKFMYYTKQVKQSRYRPGQALRLQEFLNSRDMKAVRLSALWEDNIKMDLQEVGGGGDWMELAQDRDR